ncbi:MAG: hypothetical protein Q9180_007362, partial [Flavoplaca navasiana]
MLSKHTEAKDRHEERVAKQKAEKTERLSSHPAYNARWNCLESCTHCKSRHIHCDSAPPPCGTCAGTARENLCFYPDWIKDDRYTTKGNRLPGSQDQDSAEMGPPSESFLPVVHPEEGDRMDGMLSRPSESPLSVPTPEQDDQMNGILLSPPNHALLSTGTQMQGEQTDVVTSFRSGKRKRANDVSASRQAKRPKIPSAPRLSKHPNQHIRPRRDSDPESKLDVYEPHETDTDTEIRGTNGQPVKTPRRLGRERLLHNTFKYR